MEAASLGFLDDSSCSQAIKSPAKTSTAAKEHVKWNEDLFFKRQDLVQASESLFVPPTESPITAVNKPVAPKVSLGKPTFDLNDCSFVSDKANSSLGILNVDNLSVFSDSSFKSTKHKKERKSKKKLQRSSRVPSEGTDFKFANIEERFLEVSKDILENYTEEAAGTGSGSSSDIEYDGSNVPELNMDCDMLSLIGSDRDSVSSYKTLDSADESGFAKSATFTKKESGLSDKFNGSSQLSKDESLRSDTADRESSEKSSTRQSIFENFQMSYDSLYKQLVAEKNSNTKNIIDKAPKTIRVCPFLDISSFDVEPILQKSCETNISSDIENTRCNQSLSIDFRPEQISARSSSFKSSVKYDSSSSETSNISSKEKDSTRFNLNQPNMSLSNGDLENEVLSGSYFVTSGTKLGSIIENSESIKDIDSRLAECRNSATFTENVAENLSGFSDLPSQSNFLSQNLSGLVDERESWCSRLGISESDFFSSDTAKEILRKDKEKFEKEQMLQSVSSDKSGVSNWSPPNQHEITAPSWFSELDRNQNADRHISIGTLISARSENVGTLSEDKNRERPYFGTTVVTPPKHEEIDDSPTGTTSVDANSEASQERNTKQIRISALSEVLDEISISDPINFASKILEKCIPTIQEESEKLNSRHDKINENNTFKYVTEMSKERYESTLSDFEESENASVKFASDDNKTKEIDIDTDIDCKSTAANSVDSSLNFSEGSASERVSIKTTKSDTCSNCSLPSSQQGVTQDFSRPASSCSSNAMPLGNAFSLQYGCMKYLNSASECNQNGIANLIQAGGSTLSCPHVCSQPMMQPNFLSMGASNSLQSVIHNAISGPFLMSATGTSVSCTGIQAPAELHFPDKIALGDSQEMILTIRNTTSIACYYHISYESAYLNGSPLPFEMAGLIYNSKTFPGSNGSTTDIKLIVAPKYEGRIEVNLQIDAFLNYVSQTLNATPATTLKTKIQFECVRPSISVLYKGNSTFNLGTLIAGSTFVEYVTVINNSEVPVPLRINLSNDSNGNQIYFGLKEMDRQKHPTSGGLKFLSPKILLYRIPASKNKSLPSSLDIPIVFESINSPVNSSITAAIETPTLSEVFAFMKISATVGNAKLVLKDTNQNPIVLQAYKGATCSHSVTVMNEGSVPVVYDIQIDGDNEWLSVSPSSLNLQPKQCSTISVTFTPQAYNTVKGNLLAAAEPHGQVFTVTAIIGHVKENHFIGPGINNPQILTTRPTRDSMDSAIESSSLIECNRKYLVWGGVDIGDVVLKTFTLRNPGHEPLQVKLFIKEKSQGFLLLDDSNHRTAVYKLILDGKEEKDLPVGFAPKSVTSYSGSLAIKSILQSDSKVFLIPLSGYGGTSNIKVLGLPAEGTGYCLNIDAPSGEDVVYKNICLHNSGVQPAFVKVLITYDGVVQNPVSKQISINPSEFVLLENEKRNICVSINYTNRNQISNNEVISILYGDEILRQRLKKEKSKSGPSNNESAYNINFNVCYDGEDRVPYDSSYKSSPKDETLFYTSLKKRVIHIFFDGENKSFSRMSFAALSEVQESFADMTLDSTISTNSNSARFRRFTIDGHSPPVKESSVRSMNRLSLPGPSDGNMSFKHMDTDSCSSSIGDKFESLRSGFLGDSYFLLDSTVVSTTHCLSIENIFSFPKEINLRTTKQGTLSETTLIVSNPTKYTVTWKLSPMSMLFSDPFDDSVDCTSSVIEFLTMSGIFKPKATENIVIKFLPQSVARFQQFFELALRFENNKSETCNIKVQGEAVADLSSTVRPSGDSDQTKQSSAKKRVKSEIFTESDTCKFPTTVSGQTSSESITVKNIALCDITLTIVKPKLPFIINPRTCIVRSKKFKRLPVHFKPLKPGNYESEIKFVCENGNELKVRLIGSCLV